MKNKDIIENEHCKIKRHHSPWGYNTTLNYGTSGYILKLLEIDKGECLSRQYHEKKNETLHLICGKCEIEHNDKKYIVSGLDRLKDKTFTIKPKEVHRIKALEDSLLVEGSTYYPKDVMRIEDNYGRINNKK